MHISVKIISFHLSQRTLRLEGRECYYGSSLSFSYSGVKKDCQVSLHMDTQIHCSLCLSSQTRVNEFCGCGSVGSRQTRRKKNIYTSQQAGSNIRDRLAGKGGGAGEILNMGNCSKMDRERQGSREEEGRGDTK